MRFFYLLYFVSLIFMLFMRFPYAKSNLINNPYNIIIYSTSYNNYNNYNHNNPYNIILNIHDKFLPNKKIYEKYKIDMVKRHTKNNTKKLKKKTSRNNFKGNGKSKSTNKGKSIKGRDNTTRRKSKSISPHKNLVAKKIKKTDSCSINSDNLGFTCYSKSVLYKIKDTWNKKHPKHQIDSSDPYIIWKTLRSVMEHEHACKRESCWLKHMCIKEGLPSNIYDLTFSPEMPKSWLHNPNEWLSSLDIVAQMKQWEAKYDDFKFIGPSPIDYDNHKMFGECVWDELCKFSLKSHLRGNIRKIGIIFNLDPHDKPGSHWVAVFLNDDKKTIYYFDSYGDKPLPQIKKFINEVIDQSRSLNHTYKYLENKKRHQFGNSECGMYSMYFITQMLQSKCFEKFQQKKITDAYMLRLRKKFFNKPV